MENLVNEKTAVKGVFFHGFLISTAGWLLSGVVSTLWYSYLAFNRNLGWENFSISTSIFLPSIIILFVFWLPISIIAGIQTRKYKYRSSLVLVIVSFFVLTLVIPYGLGLLVAMAGGF